MSRPGYDLSWKAIRHQHKHMTEQNNSPISAPTPLLADSSRSLLANVSAGDEQSYTNGNNTLPMTIMKHIVSSQQSKCKNPHHHHHHEPNDVLLPRDMRAFRSELRTIISELRVLTSHIKGEEEEDDISQDWKFSAMVIDRLCLVLFSMMTIILSYITLFSAKNFFKLR